MAKKEIAKIKLQIPAGAANPSPPVGPALGQHGLNIMEFCKAFNAATQEEKGMIIPVVITAYSDRSFSFITKTPPAAVLSGVRPRRAMGLLEHLVGLVAADELFCLRIPAELAVKLHRDVAEVAGR